MNSTFSNEFEEGESLLHFIYLISMNILAILLNGSIAGSILAKKIIRSYSNFMFFNIVFSDFLSAILFLLGGLFKYVFLNNFGVLLIAGIDNACYSVSVISLSVLTYHRFNQVKCPFKENEKLNLTRKIGVCLIWLYSQLLWIIYSIFTEKFIELNIFFTFYMLMNIFTYGLPVIINIILCCLTIHLIYSKKKHSSISLSPPHNTTSNITLRATIKRKFRLTKEKKAIFCLLSLSVLFFVSWFYFIFITPISVYQTNRPIKYGIGEYLVFIYPVLNPVILLFFNKKFRGNITFCIK